VIGRADRRKALRMRAALRIALLAAAIPWMAPLPALAADAGASDAGPDGGTDTDTELCDGACADPFYNACACGPDDPCGWTGDSVCDEACVELGYVDEMFDDSADCDPVVDGGADTDTDSDADSDTSTDSEADSGVDGTVSLSDSACSCSEIGGAARAALLALLARTI
jgi:hypothetical protein